MSPYTPFLRRSNNSVSIDFSNLAAFYINYERKKKNTSAFFSRTASLLSVFFWMISSSGLVNSMNTNKKVKIRNLQTKLSHSLQNLVNTCQSLLVLVDKPRGPVLELLLNDLDGLLVVLGEFDSFPQFVGSMSSFDGLHATRTSPDHYSSRIQVDLSILLTKSRVTTICQRTTLFCTQTSDGIGVSAENLLLHLHLRLEGAELVVNNGPNNIIVLHFLLSVLS